MLKSRTNRKEIKVMGLFLVAFLGGVFSSFAFAKTLDVDFGPVDFKLNCSHKGVERFTYSLGPDKGLTRVEPFYLLDDYLPDGCRQAVGSPYSLGKRSYHRAHLVSRVAFDNDEAMMRSLSHMVNVVPMDPDLHVGAWTMTEELEELLREEGRVVVVGGVKYTDRKMMPHGIGLPWLFWKVVWLEGTEHVWAFVFPNSNVATRENIHKFVHSIYKLEREYGVSVEVIPEEHRYFKKVSVPIVTTPEILQ